MRRWQTILVKNYYLVIEEDYASDSPGYCGKMLLGVYGAPEIYQLYSASLSRLDKTEEVDDHVGQGND